MIYSIFFTRNFKATVKALLKKDPKLNVTLYEELKRFNKTQTISIGSGVYKLRLRRQNQGKSGSYRLYVYLIEVESTLIPLTMFAKNQKPDISDKELSGLLRAAKIEFKLS